MIIVVEKWFLCLKIGANGFNETMQLFWGCGHYIGQVHCAVQSLKKKTFDYEHDNGIVKVCTQID